MILYTNQIIRLKRYDEPAIYLGYDKTNNKKIWAVCLDMQNNPELDWFMETDVDYYYSNTTNKATPEGRQIVFGKYKINWISGILSETPSEETINKFGAYVKELVEKYGKKETKKDE